MAIMQRIRNALGRIFGRRKYLVSPYAVSRPSTFYDDVRNTPIYEDQDEVRTQRPRGPLPTAKGHTRAPQALGQRWLPGAIDRGTHMIALTLLDESGRRTFRIDATAGADVGAKVKEGLNIKKPGVRPKHCQFFTLSGFWFVADWGVGQTLNNGTRVVGAARVEPGDLITLGSASLIFEGEVKL